MAVRSPPAVRSTTAALLVLLLSGAVQARPDASRMTCSAVREVVFQHGAIVMSTGPTTFDRFVESQRYCQPVNEIATPAIVSTRDNPQCWIGYVCRDRAGLNLDK